MHLASDERRQISPRLKQALVADLVMEDLSRDADHWLVDLPRDESEWTEHLARQLGIARSSSGGGIHDTLLTIVWELDELLDAPWPPVHDSTVCRQIAHEATKHLSALEIHTTLLAGPAQWKRERIEAGCKIERLAGHMQPLLEKGIAAELNRVIARWTEWDIRQLRDRRREALDAARNLSAAAETPVQRVPYRRPTGRERFDRLKPRYQPPGRT